MSDTSTDRPPPNAAERFQPVETANRSDLVSPAPSTAAASCPADDTLAMFRHHMRRHQPREPQREPACAAAAVTAPGQAGSRRTGGRPPPPQQPLPPPYEAVRKSSGSAETAAEALGSVPRQALDKASKDGSRVHGEFLQSAHTFEAANMNDQEEVERLALERRRRKVLRSAGTFRRHMYDLTESLAFNGLILAVILLNTGIMCALTYDTVAVRAGWHAMVLDHIFLVIYFMECVLKLYVWRLDYFKEQWNIIDFTIVIVNIADFSVSTLVGNDVNILNFIGIFRAMRALRALRVLRTVRFLKSLQVIMNTCLQSVQSMGAITMLISLFLYMFAVIGRGLYADVDPKRFGNLGSAMFTLFQLLTLDDWFYIYTEAVAKDPGNFHIIFYLVLYIAFEYFIFLNLFVAVLVDNFQLTLEAAAAKEAIRKAAMKAEEEEVDDDAVHETHPKSIASSVSSEDFFKHKKTVEDFYTADRYNERDTQSLAHYFRLLAAIDYNGHLARNQKGTLDKVVEVAQETTDDA